MGTPAGQPVVKSFGPNRTFVVELINMSPAEPQVLSGSVVPFQRVLPSVPFFPSTPFLPSTPGSPAAPLNPTVPASPCAPRINFS